MPLRPEDAYNVASMHLAHTPRGLRLVQVDPEFEVERAERGRPLIGHFDAQRLAQRGRAAQPPRVGARSALARDDASDAPLRLPTRRAGVRGQPSA